MLTFLVLGHQKGCSLLCMYGYPHALTLLPQFTTVHGSRGSIARILGKEVIRGGIYSCISRSYNRGQRFIPIYVRYDTVTLSFFGGGAVIMKEPRVLMPRWMCQRYMCIPYKRPG